MDIDKIIHEYQETLVKVGDYDREQHWLRFIHREFNDIQNRLTEMNNLIRC